MVSGSRSHKAEGQRNAAKEEEAEDSMHVAEVLSTDRDVS